MWFGSDVFVFSNQNVVSRLRSSPFERHGGEDAVEGAQPIVVIITMRSPFE